MTEFVKTIDGFQTKGSQEAGFAKARKAATVTVCDVDLYLEDPLLGDPKLKDFGIAIGEALINKGWPKNT